MVRPTGALSRIIIIFKIDQSKSSFNLSRYLRRHLLSGDRSLFVFVCRSVKDVVTPYTHISEASRYILYTIILTFDGICTIS